MWRFFGDLLFVVLFIGFIWYKSPKAKTKWQTMGRIFLSIIIIPLPLADATYLPASLHLMQQQIRHFAPAVMAISVASLIFLLIKDVSTQVVHDLATEAKPNNKEARPIETEPAHELSSSLEDK